MGKFGRKPASPQNLRPLRCHTNWDAGTGWGPGPSPHSLGLRSLRKQCQSPWVPLPAVSQPTRAGAESQSSWRVSILWYKSHAPGAGFAEGNEQAGCLGPSWVTWHFLWHCWLRWHQELPLWDLRTAFAQQFLKMLDAVDQMGCK